MRISDQNSLLQLKFHPLSLVSSSNRSINENNFFLLNFVIAMQKEIPLRAASKDADYSYSYKRCRFTKKEYRQRSSTQSSYGNIYQKYMIESFQFWVQTPQIKFFFHHLCIEHLYCQHSLMYTVCISSVKMFYVHCVPFFLF